VVRDARDPEHAAWQILKLALPVAIGRVAMAGLAGWLTWCAEAILTISVTTALSPFPRACRCWPGSGIAGVVRGRLGQPASAVRRIAFLGGARACGRRLLYTRRAR